MTQLHTSEQSVTWEWEHEHEEMNKLQTHWWVMTCCIHKHTYLSTDVHRHIGFKRTLLKVLFKSTHTTALMKCDVIEIHSTVYWNKTWFTTNSDSLHWNP